MNEITLPVLFISHGGGPYSNLVTPLEVLFYILELILEVV